MALTKDNIRDLTRPFSTNDHEFIRGYVYISELAITTRLDEVDPSWTFEVLSNVQRDKQMIATARMTVNEVFRDGVGMQSMEYLTDYDKQTRTKSYRLDPEGNKIDSGEAEKASATDALRRCARLFGVGRYLLDNPPKVVTDDYGNVKDRKAFDEWLNVQIKAHADKWGYELPSKIAGYIGPTPDEKEPKSESMPKAVGDDELTPEQVKHAKERLGNGGKRRIEGEPKTKTANGLGVTFGRWYADNKESRNLPSQNEVLESMGIKFPNEFAGTAEEFERALDEKWPMGNGGAQ